VFKALQARLDRRAGSLSRSANFALAALLLVAGVWLEIMLGYADFVPGMFKPVLALAGGEATSRIAAVNAALVSYFEPALAVAAALLLLARQGKSALERRAPVSRRRVALAGAVASLCVVAIGAFAAYRHHTGADRHEGMGFAVGGDALGANERTYGSLFAPDVPCHVSSLYGWRDDPLQAGHSERHQGVDLAVKAGTPIHAMADGKVVFAQFDSGLGNFVALQVGGRDGAPTLLNGHMQTLLVQAGADVHRGDVIGLAGSTGRATGPHVHLQICPDGRVQNGHFICGGSTNPYENWPTLAALAHMSCVGGPEIF
jgi:murein DD-endopeptidase MepM/ murein hydrolase activator NlpD